MMKILYCTSEASPLFKLGGLGDVAGSLPKAIAQLGVDIRIALPYFSTVDPKKFQIPDKPAERFSFLFDGQREIIEIFETKLPDSSVPVYLFGNPTYLSIYVSSKEYGATVHIISRFVFFSEAVANWIKKHKGESDAKWMPNIVHLNDWHTSLLSTLVDTKTLLTIHNLSYQGVSKKNGQTTNLLKLGIENATMIATVSPTYAREILTKEHGEHLEDILIQRKKDLVGILNGIDTDYWSPKKDRFLNLQLATPNLQQEVKKWKKRNKYTLQKSIGLPPLPDVPLLAFIGRVEPKQKGIDILLHALEDILPKLPAQIIILGTGEAIWEDKLHKLVHQFAAKKKIVFIDRFDEPLAHQIYAGADFVLIPSKFEPCGLVQMIAMRYGSIPVVRATGGLKDTVDDGQTGIVFPDYSAKSLATALYRSVTTYYDSFLFNKLIVTCMRQDFSWGRSAKEYLKLYNNVLKRIY